MYRQGPHDLKSGLGSQTTYVKLFPSISSAQLWTYFSVLALYFSVLDLYLAVLALYFSEFPVFLLANLALCRNFQNSLIKQRKSLKGSCTKKFSIA